MTTHQVKVALTLKFYRKTADKSQLEECKLLGWSPDCSRLRSHSGISLPS